MRLLRTVCGSLLLILPTNSWTTGPHTRRLILQRFVGFSTAVVVKQPSLAKNLPDPVSVDTSKAGTRETLEPIQNLRQSLEMVCTAVSKDDESNIETLVKTIPSSEKHFKAVFDAYSDPLSYKQKFVDQNAFLVYYTKGFDGSGRPSIESDLPVKQTQQYGARNDAWVAWEDFLAEFDYQKRSLDGEKQDLLQPLSRAIAAIDGYLQASGVVP